jgi:Cft2 family RNA processing exonuclease
VDDLSRWLDGFRNSAPHVHVVHGEPESKSDFSDQVESKLGFKSSVPGIGDVLEL